MSAPFSKHSYMKANRFIQNSLKLLTEWLQHPPPVWSQTLTSWMYRSTALAGSARRLDQSVSDLVKVVATSIAACYATSWAAVKLCLTSLMNTPGVLIIRLGVTLTTWLMIPVPRNGRSGLWRTRNFFQRSNPYERSVQRTADGEAHMYALRHETRSHTLERQVLETK